MMWTWLYEAFKGLGGLGGYATIFVVALLGTIVPFVPIPYLAAVYFLSLLLPENPFVIGFVSGLGAGVGKVVVYLMGRGARVLLSKETAERYERMGKLLRNYGALAVFLFSATPSPDDVIIIPLGMMKYNVLKLFAGLVAGKTVIATTVAHGGRAVAWIAGGELLTGLAISIVLFIIVMLILIFLDWEAMLTTLGERGVREFIRELRSKGLAAFVRKRGGSAAQKP